MWRNIVYSLLGVKFLLAKPLQNCTGLCSERGAVCLPGGFAGVDVKAAFENLGLSCNYESAYRDLDQPCYGPGYKFCFGTRNLPHRINCTFAHDPRVQRLCPCAGEPVHAIMEFI